MQALVLYLISAGSLQAQQPGFYVGPWQQPSGTHWLVLYLNPERQQAFMYEPPAALGLCAFTVLGSSVTFQSPSLMIRTAGIRYNFHFVGRLSAGGLQGRVTVVGGLHNGERDTVRLKLYSIPDD